MAKERWNWTMVKPSPEDDANISEITIRILRCSGRASRRLCAQSSASPSMFSLSRPSRIISPRFLRARRQGASALL